MRKPAVGASAPSALVAHGGGRALAARRLCSPIVPTPPRPAATSSAWAEGPNYTITIEGTGVVLLRVRRNTALSRTEGAAAAEQMVNHLGELVGTQHGLVLDLVDATTTWGPQTDAALVRMLAPFEHKRLPVRIVCADEPIQVIAVKSLLSRAAPQHGGIADTAAAAVSAIEAAPKSGRGV